MKFQQVRFNGSFLKLNAFRQDAGPEVDAAWKSLGADFSAVRIPASEAAASNIRADQVKVKEKYGGGFPANVEGLHHLHCLNLLRKSLPWNIEYYKAMKMGPFANEDHILKAHVSKSTHYPLNLTVKLTMTNSTLSRYYPPTIDVQHRYWCFGTGMVPAARLRDRTVCRLQYRTHMSQLRCCSRLGRAASAANRGTR
jgi:hypothetical protein